MAIFNDEECIKQGEAIDKFQRVFDHNVWSDSYYALAFTGGGTWN